MTERGGEKDRLYPRSRDDRCVEHGRCLSVESSESVVHELAKRRALSPRGRELAEEKGIAVGLGQCLPNGNVASQGGEHRLDRGFVETAEVQHFGAGEARERNEQGLPARAVACSHRANDEKRPGGREPGEVPQHLVGGQRRPVQVLEDQQDRSRPRQARQLLDEHALHLRLCPHWVDGGDRVIRVGAEPLLDMRSERLEKGLIGRLGAVCACAEEDAGARFVNPARELRDETRLADSRLAGDERDEGASPGGLLPPLQEQREFSVPAKERVALSRKMQSDGKVAGAPSVVCRVGESHAIRHVEPAQECRDVTLDRALGDAQPRRDLRVCEAFADGSEHLGLPSRDGTHAGATPARLHLAIVPQQVRPRPGRTC